MTGESRKVSIDTARKRSKGSPIATFPRPARRRVMKEEAENDQRKPRPITVSCHVDDRGFLYQIFGNYPLDFPDVKRVYVVGNFSKGVIRGYHMHKEESKAYFVVSGTAKFVAAKDDKNVSVFLLSYRNPSVLWVPPRFYHGWISLEDNTVLVGLSDKTLEQSLSDDFRIDYTKFGEDVWRVKNR